MRETDKKATPEIRTRSSHTANAGNAMEKRLTRIQVGRMVLLTARSSISSHLIFGVAITEPQWHRT